MSPFDSNLTNSYIHLYRGELGRMVSYRIRLDTTTNWSIITTAGVTTLALGDPLIPHVVFLFAMFLRFFFFHLEARRFRVYELSRHRVRVLERYFYKEMLTGETDPTWKRDLRESLHSPRSPVSYLNALGWRLRRNYLWLYTGVFIIWFIKLDFVEGQSLSLAEFVSRADVGRLPGAATLAGVASFYLILLALSVSSSMRHRLEDD